MAGRRYLRKVKPNNALHPSPDAGSRMASTSFRIRRSVAAAAIVGAIVAVPQPGAAHERAHVPADSTVRGLHSDHVIIVSLDGLRPDAIERFGARNLLRLMRSGSYSLQAQTIMPSKTLPSHTSMLTGAEPEEHGVIWNTAKMDEHGHVATPTIFAAAKAAGFSTAAFFSKEKFQHLIVPGTLDHGQAPDGFPGKWLASRTVGDAIEYIEDHAPNLMFVHIAEPDFAGHLAGWMSRPYGWAVREADEKLGELLRAADRVYGANGYTVIVTADHGGHGRDHGTTDARDVTIPWIAWGRAVKPGVELPAGIRTVDTAATALWLLGLSGAPAHGVPVAAAFDVGTPVPVVPVVLRH